MKRLAALLLAGIMILSLTACSTDDSTMASTEQPAASQSTPEPQTEEQPADTQSTSDTQTTEEEPAASEEGAAAESDTVEQPQAGDETGAPAEEATGSDSEQSDSASASSNILIAYFPSRKPTAWMRWREPAASWWTEMCWATPSTSRS